MSLPSHISKIFERPLYKQIETFMSNKTSTKFSGFCKSYNTQYCSTYKLETWKNTLDKDKHFVDIFMGLSKAFDTINHVLLIAKMEIYTLSGNVFLLMRSYLKNRSPTAKIIM